MHVAFRVGSTVMPRISPKADNAVREVVKRNLGHMQGESQRCINSEAPREGYRAWIETRFKSSHSVLQKKDEDGDIITLKLDREPVESRFHNFEATKKAAELCIKEALPQTE